MRRRWALPVGMLLVWMLALAWRLPHLNDRPMHGDEAVHAVKLNTLWQKGEYTYDPNEYHGPTLYYFTLPILWLSGGHSFGDMNETMLRIVPALFGAGLVLLLWLIADGLGRWSTFWAGVIAAISPCMTFYSRYYIQETLLVFFSFAVIVAAWRYTRSGRLFWALMAGVCVGLMHATKETWVISAACMLLALPLTSLWTRWVDGKYLNWRPHIRPKDKIRALILGVTVSVLLLSAFFTNPRGPLDSVLTFTTYFKRGSGESVHNHPWDYYLRMLLYTRSSKGPIFSPRLPKTYNFTPPIAWSEGLIVVLSLTGMIAALWHRGIGRAHLSLLRFLAFYTLLITFAYCAIPYKTPWCMMNFLLGMIMLAGFGAVATVRSLPGVPLKAIFCLLVIVAGGQLATQAYAANFKYSADRRNPYVYAHPLPDVLKFASDMEELAQVYPQHYDMPISIITPDYWPLPWYLRRFKQDRIGYWNSLQDVQPQEAVPQVLSAPIVITSVDLQQQVKQKLQTKHQGQNIGPYQEQYIGLRPEVFLVLYIRNDLWQALLRHREQVSQSSNASG